MIKRYRRRHRLDKGMKGWIVNYSRRNYWRCSSPAFDLDDLVQEGYICYCRCLERYGHLTEQRHFMALVKITFINHIHTLAAKRTKTHEWAISDTNYAKAAWSKDGGLSSSSDVLGELASSHGMYEHEEQTFHVLLGQLPAELRELLETLLHDAKLPPMRDERGVRLTTNQWLCRLAKLDPKLVNIEQKLREHFT